MTAPTTRFAPSPTGPLHLGHAFSAWSGWRIARDEGGRFRLRIDDLDAGRCRPAYEADLIEDLRWLGLDWDPPVRRESDCLPEYRAALDRLDGMGLLYPCFCTRREVQAEAARIASAPHGPDGPVYPGTCRALPPAERAARIAEGRAYAVRLDVGRASRLAGPLTWFDRTAGRIAAVPEAGGDVVLARKDAACSYALAVVVDDAAQGVTLVTRGLDLFEATHLQRLLQALLGLPSPTYAHHPLVVDAQGRRLAKRADAASIRAFRAAGRSAAEVWAMAGVTRPPA